MAITIRLEQNEHELVYYLLDSSSLSDRDLAETIMNKIEAERN